MGTFSEFHHCVQDVRRLASRHTVIHVSRLPTIPRQAELHIRSDFIYVKNLYMCLGSISVSHCQQCVFLQFNVLGMGNVAVIRWIKFMT